MPQNLPEIVRPRRPLQLRRSGRVSFGAGIHQRAEDYKPGVARGLGKAIHLELPPSWDVHDQGERGACVAHATMACLEYFLFRKTRELTQLSAQFVHFKMRALQKRRHVVSDRTWLWEAAEVLENEGICLQAQCAYDPFLWPFGADGAPPTTAALKSAAKRRFKACVIEVAKRQDFSAADHVYGVLQKGYAAAVAIPVQPLMLSPGLTNWTKRMGQYHGIVVDPNGDCPEGHAVCIIGYLKNSKVTGGGWFVCRNSWGLQWASEAHAGEPFAIKDLPGRGYGVISAEYLNTLCSEIFTICEATPPSDKTRGPKLENGSAT